MSEYQIGTEIDGDFAYTIHEASSSAEAVQLAIANFLKVNAELGTVYRSIETTMSAENGHTLNVTAWDGIAERVDFFVSTKQR